MVCGAHTTITTTTTTTIDTTTDTTYYYYVLSELKQKLSDNVLLLLRVSNHRWLSSGIKQYYSITV